MSIRSEINPVLMNDGVLEMPKRILFITPHYSPDYGPSAPIFTWLCEDLVKLGYQVTVICGVPHYAQAEKFASLYPKRINYEFRSGVDIFRIKVVKVPRKGIARRMLYHFLFNWNTSIAAMKIKKPDVIIGSAPALCCGLPLLFKAIWQKIPFIYVVFDIYPDVLEKLEMVRARWFLGLINRVEKYFYSKSSSIVALSEGFKKNLVSKGVDEKKIRIVPTCVDIDFFHPIADTNHFRTEWNLRDKFVVLYAGNVGYSQGLDTVLEAAALLSDTRQIEFVIVGNGVTLESLKHSAQLHQLKNVQFHDYLPFHEVPHLYAASDACLVSMKPELVVESVPSKTFTIMACGKPVIATVDANSEVGRLLQEAHCGLCVPPKDAVALAREIKKLYSSRDRQLFMAYNSRDFVVRNYCRKVAAEKYCDLIESVWS